MNTFAELWGCRAVLGNTGEWLRELTKYQRIEQNFLKRKVEFVQFITMEGLVLMA